MSEENIKRKINTLLKELQEITGVSNEEIGELEKIINHADFSQDHE